MKKNISKGFTLIELLVVVAIIAILALIVLLAINPVETARKSRDARRLSDLKTIRNAIDLSLAEKQSLTATGVIVINPGTDVTNFDGSGLDISKYIPVIPEDPVNDGSGDNAQVVLSGCTVGTAAKNSMVYEYRSDGDTYVLRARLESKDNCNVVSQDGNPNNYYELGTDPGLDLI